jgi:hypothetical protein
VFLCFGHLQLLDMAMVLMMATLQAALHACLLLLEIGLFSQSI